MKEFLEVVEKFLLVITLAFFLVASGWRCAEYISAQSSIVNAKAIQEKEVVSAQKLIIKTYSELLVKLDGDIKKIDKQLEDESCRGTLGERKLFSIRQSKVAERNQLLTLLGSHVAAMNVQAITEKKGKVI